MSSHLGVLAALLTRRDAPAQRSRRLPLAGGSVNVGETESLKARGTNTHMVKIDERDEFSAMSSE